MEHGKTITVFWVNGTPEGIITSELSGWNGKGIKLPRDAVASSKREELSGPGVYFLFCSDTESGEDAVYIGESEFLQGRLNQHIQDYISGREKFFWHTVVAFTGTELNKTLVRYLEFRMVEIAKKANRFIILTQKTSKDVVMKEHERDNMESFIDNLCTLLAALGFRVLEPVATPKLINNKKQELFIKSNSFDGRGYVTESNEFILQKGSKINRIEARSCPAQAHRLRERLTRNGKVIDSVTTDDIAFKSSSMAASFLSGYSISGPEKWKNSDGLSLKDIQK